MLQTERYTASGYLLFKTDGTTSRQIAGLQPTNSANGQTARSIQDTNVQLVKLGDVASSVAQQVGHGLTPTDVKDMLTVEPVADTFVVRVSATSTSASEAALVANTYCRLFVDQQQTLDRTYYRSALKVVTKQLAQLSLAQRQSSSGLSLEARAQSLSILADLRSSTVRFSQQATVPKGPSSPKTIRNVVAGAFLGLMLGLGVALMTERLDRTVRTPTELTEGYGLPLIGTVQASAALSQGARDADAFRSDRSPEQDSFELIHAHLRFFNVDRQLRTVLVTSAIAGDGKTTVASHLARAAARLGSKTVLLEADVRRSGIADRFGLARGPGLSDVLVRAVTVDEALQEIELPSLDGHAEGERSLSVIVGGAAPPPNPAELIESQAMSDLLSELAGRFEFIIIDAPPVNAVPDALMLAQRVDGVLVVGRVGHDRRDAVERAREVLVHARAPALGVIANDVKNASLRYGDEYGYSSSAELSAARPS